jgi:hypothetical protein
MKRFKLILSLSIFFIVFQATAQEREMSGPVYLDSARAVPVSAFQKRN